MTAIEKLQSAGLPGKYVVIDFETYFDEEYTLSNMSQWAYIKDPRFEIIGCGFYFHAHDHKQAKGFYWADALTRQFEFLQSMYGNDLNGITVVVQNGHFDCLVLQEVYGILPMHCVDIMHLDAHIDSRRSHRLKDMAKRFKLEAKGDTAQFKGLRASDMTLDQRAAMVEYCELDCELEKQLFEVLMPYMTCEEIELPTAWHTTQLYLNPQFAFDFELANELLEQMKTYIVTSCELVNMDRKDVSGNLSFVTVLKAALDEIGEEVPTKKHKRPGKKMTALLGAPGIGPALSKEDDGMKWMLAHTNDRVRLLVEARTAVKSWNTHILRIEKMIEIAASADGLLPVPLAYYGAHTGRAQGRGGINLCNLGGRGRAGSGNHPLIGRVRSLLRAGRGRKMCIADSAQIEARLLAWIAGCTQLVQGFANGEDIYSDFATGIYDSVVRKPVESDPDPISKVLSIRRGFGKDTILGAGYGMGPDKFHSRCLQNAALRPMFDDGTYDIRFIQKCIYGYRKQYKEIPAFWKTVEKMFQIVTKWPCERFGFAIPGTTGDILSMWNDNGTVCIQLPSGRVLYYRHASVNRDGQITWEHGHLWGGSLTENIVQAIARDLLVWWIMKLERIGIHVVHHVYDEVIAVVPENEADDTLETMLGVLRTAPAWASTVPLDAEGMISDVYTK